MCRIKANNAICLIEKHKKVPQSQQFVTFYLRSGRNLTENSNRGAQLSFISLFNPALHCFQIGIKKGVRSSRSPYFELGSTGQRYSAQVNVYLKAITLVTTSIWQVSNVALQTSSF